MKKHLYIFVSFLSAFNLGMFSTRIKSGEHIELYKIIFSILFLIYFFYLYKEEKKGKNNEGK